MKISRLIAILALLGLVPGSIYAAYAGHQSGLYPYSAIPIAFGVVFAVIITALFVLLPVVQDKLDS